MISELQTKNANLIINDISEEAINLAKSMLGSEAEKAVWLCQNIAEPLLMELPKVDVWIDRAVLHFLTDEDDILGYFQNLFSVLTVGGFALFAEFSEVGALKCAGLTLHRYSVNELVERLGDNFTLVEDIAYTFINPAGEPRPYIYALFRRDS